MKTVKDISAVMLAAALLAGCGTTAKHSLNRGTVVSAVQIVDAPAGAIVQAGEKAVRANKKGEARLVLADGWHDLYIFDGTSKVHEERVFLQDGTQKLIDLKP